jgi:hypothetical protein
MLLIEELAEGLGLSQWPGDAETIVEIGDLENTSLLGVFHDQFSRDHEPGQTLQSSGFQLSPRRPPVPDHGTQPNTSDAAPTAQDSAEGETERLQLSTKSVKHSANAIGSLRCVSVSEGYGSR